MANTPVIAATQAAANYDFTLQAGASAQVYNSPELSPRERVRLARNITTTEYIPVNAGPTGDVLLSSGKNSALVVGPGDFRIVKPATTTATAIFLDL